MIGLALSGGGSRAIAFHLGCLRALNDLGLLDKIEVISTISGGSVIGAYYAYTPHKSFSEFESDICHFLRRGFQWSIFKELAKPTNFIWSGTNLLATATSEFLSRTHLYESKIQRYPTRTDMFYKVLQRDVFPNLKMSSLRRRNIDIVIGACELRKGIAFRFGNTRSGDWRHGAMVDWDVEVAFAVAASAAYPILLPAFDRKWKFIKDNITHINRVLITDGGVYDNLGLQVLEPGRNPNMSIHSFSCKYIIACNAGDGQEPGEKMHIWSLPRIKRSFEIVHRRAQDTSMSRLHNLKESGILKGFILPYLGQQDHQIPWKVSKLISRSQVLNYPTDFAGMSDEWIEKLSLRGEQLTREFAEHYLTDLL